MEINRRSFLRSAAAPLVAGYAGLGNAQDYPERFAPRYPIVSTPGKNGVMDEAYAAKARKSVAYVLRKAIRDDFAAASKRNDKKEEGRMTFEADGWRYHVYACNEDEKTSPKSDSIIFLICRDPAQAGGGPWGEIAVRDEGLTGICNACHVKLGRTSMEYGANDGTYENFEIAQKYYHGALDKFIAFYEDRPTPGAGIFP
jgi:hypothetical protein